MLCAALPSSSAETSVPRNEESVILTGAKNIGNVPIIAQKPEFPTGCESVSAVMVLKYARAKVEDRFEKLGRQSLVVLK